MDALDAEYELLVWCARYGHDFDELVHEANA